MNWQARDFGFLPGGLALLLGLPVAAETQAEKDRRNHPAPTHAAPARPAPAPAGHLPAAGGRPGPAATAMPSGGHPGGGNHGPGAGHPQTFTPPPAPRPTPQPLGPTSLTRPSAPPAARPGPVAAASMARPAGAPGALPGRPGGLPGPGKGPGGPGLGPPPGSAAHELRVAPGKVIRQGPGGARQFEVRRKDGRLLVVSPGGHQGFLQRPLALGGRTFAQRTYLGPGGSTTVRLYRPYAAGDQTYYIYAPYRYYSAGFYPVVAGPWPGLVVYAWDWTGEPWYGYYRGYFVAAPSYGDPSAWLADHILGDTLRQAYLARLDAGLAADPGDPGEPMPAEARQALTDEVRKEIAEEAVDQKAGAPAGGPPSLFQGTFPRTLLAAAPVNGWAGNRDWPILPGDVLRVPAPLEADAAYAQVEWLASRDRNRPRGTLVTVGVADLVEMQNQMRANLDQDLADLQARQGQGGLPALPGAALGPAGGPLSAKVRPDPTAPADLSGAARELAGAEANAGPPAGGTVGLGMTVAEVERSLGKPATVADLGARQIHVYPKLKVTFTDGRVSDIQ